MNINLDRYKIQNSFGILFSLVLFFTYCLTYVPFGFENNDQGFTLGLSYQIFLGGRLYDDVIYVRPPVTPILHSIVFYKPFSHAPIFYDRVIYFFEIFIYSFLSAFIARRFFLWSANYTSLIAALIFIFSAHTFPPMGWHTVDGITFSVISIFMLVKAMLSDERYYFLSVFFAIIAAGTKQSFYVIPILVVGLIFFKERRVSCYLYIIFSFVASGLLLFYSLNNVVSFEFMFGLIASSGTFYDFLNAGIYDYIKDFFKLHSIIFVWPLGAILLIKLLVLRSGVISDKWLALSFLLIIAGVLNIYWNAHGLVQAKSIIDTVFVFTLLCSGLMLLRTRSDAWLFIVAMHVIAWASSVSWSYLSTGLYAAPSIIALAVIFRLYFSRSKMTKPFYFALIPLAIVTFLFGNRYLYSLEGVVMRSDASMNMANISPALNAIMAQPQQVALYSELLILIRDFDDSPYVVMPNIPLAHVLSGSKNPIGIDWTLNAEVGNGIEIVQMRLNSKVRYAVVYNNAFPPPKFDGKFGSAITASVIDNWHLIKSSQNFMIYENLEYK